VSSLWTSAICWQANTSNKTARGRNLLTPFPLVFDKILVRHILMAD